jgi:hypothetical protein
MAQSGVLQASRIQLIRGLVRTMTKPTSPPTDPASLPQVSSAAGRLFRWETDTCLRRPPFTGVQRQNNGALKQARNNFFRSSERSRAACISNGSGAVGAAVVTLNRADTSVAVDLAMTGLAPG